MAKEISIIRVLFYLLIVQTECTRCSFTKANILQDDTDSLMLIQTKVQTSGSPLLEEIGNNLTVGADTGAAKIVLGAHAEPYRLESLAKHIDAPSEPLAIVFFVLLLILIAGVVSWMLNQTEAGGKHSLSVTVQFSIAFLLISVVCVAIYFAAMYFAGFLLKKVVEHYDMAFLGVSVSMQNVRLNPFNGILNVDSLDIGNPKGYHSDHLLRAKSLLIDIDMLPLVFSLFSHVELSALKLSGVTATYEQALTTSNVQDLLNHLQGDQKKSESKSATRITVREVSVKDFRVEGKLHLMGSSGISLQVPDMHYKDFDKEVGSQPADTVVDVLLGTLLKSILRVVPG